MGSLFFKSKEIKTYPITDNKVSQILDNDGKVVSQINLIKDNSVKYNELPDVFINALISGEDSRFFSHSGIDLQRIITSLISNIKGNNLQGASTLTQQLIKNTLLDSSKTLDRKLNEIILSLKLEGKLTKEEILEAYCNNIMFDGISLGVNSASMKLFNKHIKYVTLPEAALLVGIVNAPSFYNPIKNPDRAKTRMVTILNLMHRHGYISEQELEINKNVEISDLIKSQPKDETNYKYQAYLDIVYKECLKLVNENLYTKPLIIETALNTKAQSLIDSIQEGKIIKFNDDNQQFALSLIDNQTGAVVASLGGRNYNGKLLFNRSYDMLNQPASTIKPLLSYALGIEVLNYNSKQVLMDKPYSYSDGTKVDNVDHNYKGELLIEDALGYSRNTTALAVLDEVIKEKGTRYVSNYLSKLHLLDIDRQEYLESYALGAFRHGVSPYNLAAAYSMIPNRGYYTQPYVIKKIIDSSTGKVIYSHKNQKTKILESSTTEILTAIMKNVVNNNYYGLGSLKLDNIPLYIKSGTSSFDSTLVKKYNYPLNASKDLWIAGFSKQYSFAIWTGFDTPKMNEKNYFEAGSDKRKSLHKEILKIILKESTTSFGEVPIGESTKKINIVKGTDLLPNEKTPLHLITEAYFKYGYEPQNVISPPSLQDVKDIDLLFFKDKINVIFNDYITLDIQKENTIYSFEKIYGDIEYVIEINNQIFTSNTPDFEIPNNITFIYELKAYTRYSNFKDITSNVYKSNFLLT